MERRTIADRFELADMLGRGGMGTVWRARDTLLDRSVAVKEVTVPAASERESPAEDGSRPRDRVLREARLAARLDHPGAVTVYDAVEQDGQVFIVMELVDAETLSERVNRDGPLGPAETAELGLALLDVLTAAHRLGIVHRDVKPGNVMVSARGAVKLADFGIARLADDSATTTTSGTIAGSPASMAPEHIRGQPGPESDLWALGVTLFFAVEGVSAFRRDTDAATLAAVLTEQPPAPARAGPELGGLLLALLAKPITARPSAERIRPWLESVLGRHTAPTPPAPPTSPPPVAPSTPSPARRTAVLGVVVLVLAGVAVWLGVAAFGRAADADRIAAEAARLSDAAAALTDGVDTGNAALSDATATAEVTERVRSVIEAAFSYDHTDLDATAAAVSDGLTGTARCQHDALYGEVKQAATTQDATLTTTVRDIAVVRLSDARAELLVFIDQVSGKADAPTRAGAQLAVHAVRQDGRWMIAELDLFDQQPPGGQAGKDC